MWKDQYVNRYFNILLKYHSKVIIELAGHDHYADLRYHSSQGMPSDLSIEDASSKFNFHNLLVAPGITPNKAQQPGFAVFEINSGVPENLQMTFLDITKFIGTVSSVPSYKELKWLHTDFSSTYGLKQLDA